MAPKYMLPFFPFAPMHRGDYKPAQYLLATATMHPFFHLGLLFWCPRDIVAALCLVCPLLVRSFFLILLEFLLLFRGHLNRFGRSGFASAANEDGKNDKHYQYGYKTHTYSSSDTQKIDADCCKSIEDIDRRPVVNHAGIHERHRINAEGNEVNRAITEDEVGTAGVR